MRVELSSSIGGFGTLILAWSLSREYPTSHAKLLTTIALGPPLLCGVGRDRVHQFLGADTRVLEIDIRLIIAAQDPNRALIIGSADHRRLRRYERSTGVDHRLVAPVPAHDRLSRMKESRSTGRYDADKPRRD